MTMKKPIFWAAAMLCALQGVLFAQTTQQQADAAIGGAQWYQRTVADGVTVRSYQFDSMFNAPQIIHVIEADMANPNVQFSFPFLAGGSRKTVEAFAADVPNAAAVVNGNFFGPTGSVQYLKVNNTLVNTTGGGVDDRGGVVIDAGGDLSALVRPGAGWASLADPNIMATNIPLVSGGTQYAFGTGTFYETDRHPRTAIGRTAANKALLVGVDGRSNIAAGMTMVELAATMIALGSVDAVNLDGGGSTTVWDTDLPGSGVGNIPSDGVQRTVVNAVAVASTPIVAPPPALDARRAAGAVNASVHAPIAATIASGQTAQVSIQFLNTGSTTWTPSNVFLATSETFNHASSLAASDWLTTSRPTALDTASVATGATGTFTFTVQAPAVTSVTSIIESYVLVDAANTAFGPHQNRLYVTVTPPATANDLVIESRLPAPGGGVTPAPAYEELDAFSNTTSKSTVLVPAVSGAGSRYNNVVGRRAAFRPTIVTSGRYSVYVTMGSGSNNNALASYIIDNADADISGTVNLTTSDTSLVNQWKLLQSNVHFLAGDPASITFRNENGNNSVGARFVMDAVRFELTAPDVPPVTSATQWEMWE